MAHGSRRTTSRPTASTAGRSILIRVISRWCRPCRSTVPERSTAPSCKPAWPPPGRRILRLFRTRPARITQCDRDRGRDRSAPGGAVPRAFKTPPSHYLPIAQLWNATREAFMTATHGFELLSEQKLPEINSIARHYRHVKRGGELLSFLNKTEKRVFNEIKGNYSSPDSMLRELSQQSLYPDITYGLDSGGDPKHIPDLTYDQFKAFHERHYHPSNAKLFFYGDDDPDERLRLLDARLAEFDRIDVHFGVPLQPRFPAPKRLNKPHAAGARE